MDKNGKFDMEVNSFAQKTELSELKLLKSEIEEELSVLNKSLEKYEKQRQAGADSLREMIEVVRKKERAICSLTSDEYLALCKEVAEKESVCLSFVEQYEGESHKKCEVRIALLEKQLTDVEKRISILRGNLNDGQNNYGG